MFFFPDTKFFVRFFFNGFPFRKNNYENFIFERDFALHISIWVFLRRRRKFLEFLGTLLTIFSVFLSQMVSKCKVSLKSWDLEKILVSGEKISIWKTQ